MKIPVLEVFGPTFQGEGRAIGQKTMFVRTAGCDYRCSWCDSAFTWDGSEKPDMLSADAIIERLDALGMYDYVTISGGNPLLIAGMKDLVEKLKARGVKLAVETQGSRYQDWLTQIDDVTLSPKPPSSGMSTDWEKLDAIVERLRPEQTTFKVAVFDEIDLAYAKQVQTRYTPDVMYLSAGNPEPSADGDITDAQLRRLKQLWEDVARDPSWQSVRVLPQLHTLLYANERGV
ncbi:7-carboxy-7-deazaguanine synthase QueE [Exiguobacterium alkaliphilum]|uniref:7-carboxy-7-deazaguanine synthase QueE n=1 Tax=Exiguobacterium alkaliphilum TaxID=1428684 RepID=UPI001BAA10DC|nr:7-carboxy-7-deazaguanine synthase QueE [Exiguobacterium alkaliphilum]QUE86458.1 7-carboxy-7-deazaguanine synthase QueE [Exiguobacterium alkaliphilum]